ncbi:hypothetical protein HYT05_01650 [Candidatus Kaiserbacteria bacterium]|nr:hypothetical protein [Candidatus Kaiserbacteria bacterium]
MPPSGGVGGGSSVPPTTTTTCPTGYTLQGSTCVAPDTTQCVINVPTICIAGYHLDTATNQCVPDDTCPAGQHLDTATNQCISDVPVVCPAGQHYDPVLRQCVSAYCPAGYTGTPPNCTIASSCPLGYTGTPPSCIPPTTYCPAGYTGTPPNCTIASSCPLGFTGTPPVCVITGNTCPAGYTGNPPNCSVASSCPLNYTGTPPNCTPIACIPSSICNGKNVVNSCTGALIQSCAYACASGACIVPPPSVVTWRVAPRIVNQGSTTNVSWEVRNVSSCTVSGTNGDSWTGLTGTKVSGPINAQTIFTLHCTALPGSGAFDVTRTATVNIVPVFQEK